MRPRFAGRLGPADAVTAVNAALGFCAVVAVGVDPSLSARLILVAGIADALDGIVARRWGSSPVGPHLDSLADVASFVVAPAAMVTATATGGSLALSAQTAVAVAVPAVFVTTGVIRLSLYTVHDVDDDATEGVQTTLSGTLLAAAVLVGVGGAVLLGGAAVLTYLMVVPVTYPDLLARDATLMGGLQLLAALLPGVVDGLFPAALLAWALAYLLLAPRFYWGRREGKR